MEITHRKLRELLERAWDLAEAAERAGVNEPALKDAELDNLMDIAEDFEE